LSLGDNALLEHCLFEFLNATSRKLGVPIALSIATVAEWTANFDVILSSKSVLAAATQLLSRHKLSVWDARILAICGESGIEFLLTEDMQDGAKYGTVTTVNPFNSLNDKLINGILAQ
jgi:predicted nucleic acid-binding protein